MKQADVEGWLSEAMDRSYIIHLMIESLLRDHKGAKLDPKAYKKILKASDLMFDAYQGYGATLVD